MNNPPNPFFNLLGNNFPNKNQFRQDQRNPLLDFLQNPALNPALNQMNNMFSNMVDRNTVNSMFSTLISSDIFPFRLHEPERLLDLLLFISEKSILVELKDENKLEFEEFIKMFRTSGNDNPERKLALFLNLLNYYTKKGNILVNEEERQDFDPYIEPVD